MAEKNRKKKENKYRRVQSMRSRPGLLRTQFAYCHHRNSIFGSTINAIEAFFELPSSTQDINLQTQYFLNFADPQKPSEMILWGPISPVLGGNLKIAPMTLIVLL